MRKRTKETSKLCLPVHETVAIGNAAITEQEHHLVRRLGTERDEVPEHIGILQVRLWVSLLRVDEAWEENGIANEEDWRIVAHNVPDAIIGVELHGKASGIASCVGRATFAT
jgi:hypothetical protein